ncbi:hypothetical protein RI046_25680 [Herbaspirillum huttiense subsp. nephrolepidis]|uniref:Uncharacterized protein n=2 Tax=Herbaspirillum huttiense TaxID=863372 RepID=A0AAJ2LXF6_9BURK|nr:hypothetical protein [Herbaspirillum huttiense]
MKTSPQSDLRGFFSSSASTGLKVFVKKPKREGEGCGAQRADRCNAVNVNRQ